MAHTEGGKARAVSKRPYPRGRGYPKTKRLWGTEAAEHRTEGWGCMVIQEGLTAAIRPGALQRAPHGDAPEALNVGTWQGREPGSLRGGGYREGSEATEGAAGAQRMGGGKVKVCPHAL